MRKILTLVLALSMALSLSACGGKDEAPATPAAPEAPAAIASGVEDGVLTVAMECAYAPYNWSQADDANGAVPIKDSSDFANGYDVM
ncbi:MAG: ABC transporter substrate-binding protein, partial [Oscillospiraceae bacterium]